MSENGRYRVIFTNDERINQDSNQNKLYTRLKLEQPIQFDYKFSLDDPIFEYIHHKTQFSETEVKESDDFIISLNILVPEGDDYVQYNAIKDNSIVDQILNNSLVEGLSRSGACNWILGLVIDGIYDDGTKYSYGMVNDENDNYTWSIQVLHNGLFKILVKVKLNRLESFDLDGYLLDDLQYYTEEKCRFNNEKRIWHSEKDKFAKNITLIEEKKEFNRLNENLIQVKTRISNYFIPLVNSLLKENNLLKETNGDVVFSSKKRKMDVQVIKEEIYNDLNDNLSNEREKNDKFLDLIHEEKNKRLQFKKEVVELDETPYLENMTGFVGNDNKNVLGNEKRSAVADEKYYDILNGDLRDEITFNNTREHRITTETQSDLIDLNTLEQDDEKYVILEEDTQIDDNTDVSDDNHTNNNVAKQTEGSSTEISSSEDEL